MVDVQKDFKDSFRLLSHHRRIIIPALLSIILSMVLVYLFLNMSGLLPTLKEGQTLALSYTPEAFPNVDSTQLQSLPEDQRKDYLGGLYDYLKSEGYFDRLLALLNMQNLMLLIAVFAAGMIGSFYFSCMSYAIVALAIKGKDLSLREVFRITNTFLFRFFSLSAIRYFIVLGPIVIAFGITGSLFALNLFLGFISLFIVIILSFIYLIFAGLRLFFAAPAMYMDETGAPAAIRHSMELAKKHVIQVLIVFGMIYMINVFFAGKYVTPPLQGSIMGFLTETSLVRMIIQLLILCLFAVIEAIVISFENLFMFYSYLDMEQIEQAVDPHTEGIAQAQYQGFWIRFLAEIIDFIVIYSPAYILQFLVVLLTGISSLTYLVDLGVICLVVYLTGVKGGTPGMVILGMRIVNERGEPIGIPTALLRFIGKLVSMAIFFMGFVIIAFDSKKQGLHDKIAGTYVVKAK